MFRNYDTRDGDWMEPTIVQAVLGTWATPDLFLPVTIGDPHMAETIHSAARGFNNPTREACLEVSRTLTPNWKAALVLSLGTGKPHPVGAHSNHNTVNLATGVTSGHNQAAFGNHGVFFRFSYPGGTADYDLALITMHTNRYLERTFISKGLDAALSVGSRSGSTPLHTLREFLPHSLLIAAHQFNSAGGRASCISLGLAIRLLSLEGKKSLANTITEPARISGVIFLFLRPIIYIVSHQSHVKSVGIQVDYSWNEMSLKGYIGLALKRLSDRSFSSLRQLMRKHLYENKPALLLRTTCFCGLIRIFGSCSSCACRATGS